MSYMAKHPSDKEGKFIPSSEGLLVSDKQIRGITVEEAERRDRQFILDLQLDESMNKTKEMYKSMLYWFGLYNFVGLLVAMVYQESEFQEIIYRIGLAVVFTASLLIFATFVGGMRTFAVPPAMIVADKNLGVIDDMRNAKDRVFNKMAGPLQGMIYGSILIFFGAL